MLGKLSQMLDKAVAGFASTPSYERGLAYLETMRELYAECGRPEDFDAYVEEVRTTHKPKRNLMKLMTALDPVKSTS